MPVWQSIILGIIQGLAEFLPISSSGHLVLFQNIFGMQGAELLLDTLLHAGTLIAVFIVLWKDIVGILKKPFQKVTLMLIIATIPAVVMAVFFEDFIVKAFGGEFLGWGFLLTAIVLLSLSFIKGGIEDKTADLNTIGVKQAGIMGLFQAVAIMPGVSRAGLTISGGLFSGAAREKAARFSFLMSIPAILGSLVFNIKDILELDSSAGFSYGTAIIGMAAAAVAGVVALKWMFSIIKKGKLWVFSIYVGILGILIVLDQLVFHVVF